MKKIVCLLLCICFLLVSFTSCGQDSNRRDDDDDRESSSSKSLLDKLLEDNDASLDTSRWNDDSEDYDSSYDDIFEDSSEDSSSDYVETPNDVAYSELEKRDLGGREFFIIERWFGYGKPTIDFSGEVLYVEEEGRPLTRVNQAKKEIIEQIQKDYNCTITGEMYTPNADSIIAELKTLVTNDIAAGTGKYDFLFESPYYYTSLIADGQLCDLSDKTLFPSLDLTSSCWDQNGVSELSICNSLYFALGDINTYDNDGTVAMLFNKNLYKALGYTEDLYQLVKDYKWTFDKLKELSTQFQTVDYNTDGEIDELDQWFMGSETANLYIHVIAAGESMITKNNEDIPVLTMSTDRTFNALLDAISFYNGGKVLVANLQKFYDKYPGNGECYEKTVTNAFLQGRELFYMTTLIHIPYFRQMKDEFGILPVPMYNEEQGEYCSAMSVHTASTLMIPNTINADDDLALVIQALAELSEEKLTLEYYEKQLKFRDFRDADSAQMLDIIFDNRHYDLGAVFGGSWNDSTDLYNELEGPVDPQATFSANESSIKALIQLTVEDILDAKGY